MRRDSQNARNFLLILPSGLSESKKLRLFVIILLAIIIILRY